MYITLRVSFFFFQAEDGIRDIGVTGVQTCALPICAIPAPSSNSPTVEMLPDFARAGREQEAGPFLVGQEADEAGADAEGDLAFLLDDEAAGGQPEVADGAARGLAGQGGEEADVTGGDRAGVGLDGLGADVDGGVGRDRGALDAAPGPRAAGALAGEQAAADGGAGEPLDARHQEVGQAGGVGEVLGVGPGGAEVVG